MKSHQLSHPEKKKSLYASISKCISEIIAIYAEVSRILADHDDLFTQENAFKDAAKKSILQLTIEANQFTWYLDQIESDMMRSSDEFLRVLETRSNELSTVIQEYETKPLLNTEEMWVLKTLKLGEAIERFQSQLDVDFETDFLLDEEYPERLLEAFEGVTKAIEEQKKAERRHTHAIFYDRESLLKEAEEIKSSDHSISITLESLIKLYEELDGVSKDFGPDTRLESNNDVTKYIVVLMNFNVNGLYLEIMEHQNVEGMEEKINNILTCIRTLKTQFDFDLQRGKVNFANVIAMKNQLHGLIEILTKAKVIEVKKSANELAQQEKNIKSTLTDFYRKNKTACHIVGGGLILGGLIAAGILTGGLAWVGGGIVAGVVAAGTASTVSAAAVTGIGLAAALSVLPILKIASFIAKKVIGTVSSIARAIAISPAYLYYKENKNIENKNIENKNTENENTENKKIENKKIENEKIENENTENENKENKKIGNEIKKVFNTPEGKIEFKVEQVIHRLERKNKPTKVTFAEDIGEDMQDSPPSSPSSATRRESTSRIFEGPIGGGLTKIIPSEESKREEEVPDDLSVSDNPKSKDNMSDLLIRKVTEANTNTNIIPTLSPKWK